jgi:hypothetical protein
MALSAVAFTLRQGTQNPDSSVEIVYISNNTNTNICLVGRTKKMRLTGNEMGAMTGKHGVRGMLSGRGDESVGAIFV